MASKLFAPFKKFPQQLPIFKKSTDKFKDVSMSNYNAVYGMLDDVTCQTFDNDLYLLALGTRKGEIKIFGSPGIVYTLVNSSLKPISFLKFLDGQGRIISINCDYEMSLWQYRDDCSNWEVTSTLNSFLPSHIPNIKVTSLDVSKPFSWKSEEDDLMELLLIGTNLNIVQQILIIGNFFHVYEEDLYIYPEYLFAKCKELDKDYDFGGIDQIRFHPNDNDKFFISYKNGLLMIMEKKVSNENVSEVTSDDKEVSPDPTKQEEKSENNNDDLTKQEETNNEKAPETNEETTNENELTNDQNETSEKPIEETNKSESEKDKVGEDVQKSDESKPETKKLKLSPQVPFTYVQIPNVINYILNNKALNTVCWYDLKINTITDDSGYINCYEMDNENLKISEPDKVVILPENFQSFISKLTYFNFKSSNMGVFVTNIDEKQQLLVIMKDDKVCVEIETPSLILDYIIVSSHKSDENNPSLPNTLLILCETQLIGINLECENLSEIQCPYLSLQHSSQITTITGVIQVPALLFGNSQSLNDVFKDWPLKTMTLNNEKIEDETIIDIFGTGHSDGSVNIWQLMSSGVLNLLAKIQSSDIFATNSKTENFEPSNNRRKIGHRLLDSEDNLLQITNLQLMLHGTNNFSESSSNELFCLVSNYTGTVLIFKYDGTDDIQDYIEIMSEIDGEGLAYNDSPPPELLNKSDIIQNLPKLNYIIKLNPPLPITTMTFQPSWDLLGIGCTYGLVLIDLRQNKCVFSHLTIHRTTKNNNVTQPPLTVGQQLKKSIRQSFRKLKKLKPASKHTYTVNEEKSKDKENKPIEKEENKEATKPEDDEEQNQKVADVIETNEDKIKEEIKDNAEEIDNTISTNENIIDSAETELVPIEISRKDKPITAVGSLLIAYTSLTSSNKIPCLFVGTNVGSIFAFEINFDDESNGSLSVKLSKELHLQHKAPIILMSITNANHVPLLGSIDQIGSYQRKFKNIDELKQEDELKLDKSTDESKPTEIDVGPSGDSESKEDAKLKSGTLPPPGLSEENSEPTAEGARRSIDSSNNKININSANMKKSGTLPASFLQAIGKTQGSSDCHELLVVSEEQVKLFSLPTLKAKYKYKVVDTGHHFTHSKTIGSQETEQEKKIDNASNETQVDPLPPKPAIRRISSVGLCKMRSVKHTGEKWGVAIALTNGEVIALQLTNLKKYLSDIFNNSSNHILAGIAHGEFNLIVSFAHKFNIQITDFSQSRFHKYEPNIYITIPKNARPVIKDKVVEETLNQLKEAQSEPTGTETVVNGHHNENEEEEEEKDQLGDEAVVQNTSTVHHGDITMDSIKEYITNVDGNVTIKTFESTKEKQITVDGGQIVTTIHEKQIKDGEIIKDDVVKITSDTRTSDELSLKE